MKFELQDSEIDFIMNVLGELPTKSGAFMLLQKLQIQKHIAAQAAETVEVEEPKAE